MMNTGIGIGRLLAYVNKDGLRWWYGHVLDGTIVITNKVEKTASNAHTEIIKHSNTLAHRPIATSDGNDGSHTKQV